MSVLLWAAEPVLIVIFAVVLLHEHVPRRLLCSLTVAVAGVVLVVYQPGVSGTKRWSASCRSRRIGDAGARVGERPVKALLQARLSELPPEAPSEEGVGGVPRP